MKYCISHPERGTISVCHNCGRELCEECLVEGKQFYYCYEPECQEKFKLENPEIIPEKKLDCPNCGSLLILSEEEEETGIVHCPECEAQINLSTSPPEVLLREHYSELLYSFNQGDIALIESIFKDAEIKYYVFGVNFLSVDPLIQPARFFVNLDDLERAKELLENLQLHFWGFSKNTE